jgi:formate/nitrite transporter FocA (FNT family)
MSSDTQQSRATTPLTSSAHEAFQKDEQQKEAQKSCHTILEQHIQQAEEDLERPAGGLLLSALSAGLDLGFGPLLMAVIGTLATPALGRPVTQMLVALAYAVGFLFVVVGRSALFTEQTTSAVLPVLAKRVGLGKLVRLWALVLAGNLVGATVIAAFIARLAPALGAADVATFGEMAGKVVNHPFWTMLFSAIAAGWLMGLLAWTVVASRETMSQIAMVIATAFVIGITGLHHSIAGSIEVLMAIFSNAEPQVGLHDFVTFLATSVLGNAIGGAVFVGLLKFGHVHASLR